AHPGPDRRAGRRTRLWGRRAPNFAATATYSNRGPSPTPAEERLHPPRTDWRQASSLVPRNARAESTPLQRKKTHQAGRRRVAVAFLSMAWWVNAAVVAH